MLPSVVGVGAIAETKVEEWLERQERKRQRRIAKEERREVRAEVEATVAMELNDTDVKTEDEAVSGA